MTILETIAFETDQVVTEETALEDMKMDSLEFLSLILAISAETGKTVDDGALAQLKTVGDVVREFS